MKLDQTTINYIEKVAKTASLVDIESVVVTQDQIRAVDENKTVVILNNDNIPTLSFDSIALPRIKELLTRMGIVQTQNNFSIETTEDHNKSFIRSLTLKGDGTKVEFRCARPDLIKAPKQANDSMKVQLQLNNNAVEMLSKAANAMKDDRVKLHSDGQQSWFEMRDVNGDTFSHTICEQLEDVDNQNDLQFEHAYPVKTLLALFKQDPSNYVQIGHRGMLKIQVNDIDTYVIPQVER